MLLLTCGLTAIAWGQARSLWRELPSPSLADFDWQALRDARSGLKGPAQEGWVLVILSDHLTRALHEPDRIPDLLNDARAGLTRLRSSQLGRLQMAALVMLQLERGEEPVDTWWSHIAPYLTGLDAASFAHRQAAFLEAEIENYERLGLSGGTARSLAIHGMGGAHAPFLQFFSTHILNVAAALDSAGDASSATYCRRLLARLLREWVLEDGAASTRMLATALLVDNAKTLAVPDRLVGEARAWRVAYRTDAKRIPGPPSLLRFGEHLTPGHALAPALMQRLALLGWCGGGLLGAVLLALGTTAFCLKPAATSESFQLRAAITLAPTLAIVVAGITVIAMSPDWVHDDLRRADADDLGQPTVPYVGGVIGAVCVLAISGAGTLLARCSALRTICWGALSSWLALAVVCLALVISSHAQWRRYDRALAEPASTHLKRLADDHAPHLLEDLRAWQP